MTKFNPHGKTTLTYGETLDPAMKIIEQADADQYLKEYADFIEKQPDFKGNETGISIAKANLGYWAGYWNDETRKRVEKLFKCAHPVFGSIEENGVPTNEQAFEMGLNAGKKQS